MTSKLKCPFCGEKLYKSNDCHVCFNANCIFANNYLFDEKWWAITKLKQALIQSQRDLAKAIEMLEYVSNEDFCTKDGDFFEEYEEMHKVIKDTLAQITHDNSENANSRL